MRKSKLPTVLMSIVAVVLIFNQWQIVSLHQLMVGMEGHEATGPIANQPTNALAQGAVDLVALAKEILPIGVPPVYGAELGISFDNAAAAIQILSRYEQDTRPDKLTGEKLERYVKIGQMTSCEFCCGARTMVFADGRKACGCAHSAAMRGVVAYLIDNFGGVATDQQILVEANKWKAVFFPGPTTQKFAAAQGLINSNASASNLQQQVGGC